MGWIEFPDPPIRLATFAKVDMESQWPLLEILNDQKLRSARRRIHSAPVSRHRERTPEQESRPRRETDRGLLQSQHPASFWLVPFAVFFDEMLRLGPFGLVDFTSFRQAESNSGENRDAQQCDANHITRYSTVGFGHAGTPVVGILTFRLSIGDSGDRYQKQFAMGKRVWHGESIAQDRPKDHIARYCTVLCGALNPSA